MAWTTPDLYDDHFEKVQVLAPLLKHFGSVTSFYGQAATIKCFEDNSVLKSLAAEPGHGRVMVVDGGGSLRCALMGDQIALSAAENGWSGVIINGCVRDITVMSEMAIGIMAIASTPRKSTRRGEGQSNLPIHFCDVSFRTGDWIYADLDGVLISPLPLF